MRRALLILIAVLAIAMTLAGPAAAGWFPPITTTMSQHGAAY
ncbi:MAG TPA: hypothetical protein VGK74_24690 [Symbiobacteriaceae bacterium]